jgi:ATP-binding cassette subfamily B protein
MNLEIDLYKAFVKQQGHSDCGVACLLSIIRFHQGNCSYEALLKMCGTSQHGTSLQGIKQAANLGGLEAEAFWVEELRDFKKEVNFPCVLLVVNKQFLNHFIICCELKNKKFYKIFDPAKGFEFWNEEHLLSVWKSKVVVLFSPNQNFKKVRF